MFAVEFKHSSVVLFDRSKPASDGVDKVVWFQASDDELDMVRQQFSGIPITRGNICNWTGDIARFVFRNLVL